MTEKEIKKMKPAELLSMLAAMEKETEALRRENGALTLENRRLAQQLVSREVKVSRAGSLAEAALQLSDVFNAAQEAAEIYLQNISKEEAFAQMIHDQAEKEAKALLEETQRKCEDQLAQTQSQCEQLQETARKAADAYWEDARQKIDEYHRARVDLQQSLQMDEDGFTVPLQMLENLGE